MEWRFPSLEIVEPPKGNEHYERPISRKDANGVTNTTMEMCWKCFPSVIRRKCMKHPKRNGSNYKRYFEHMSCSLYCCLLH